MTPLTDRQTIIFEFICKFLLDNGYLPSVRDIMEVFDMTPNGVCSHLRALQRKGWISGRDHKGRAFQILAPIPVKPVREGNLLKIGTFVFQVTKESSHYD